MAGMPVSRAQNSLHGISTSTTLIASWLAPSVGITCGSGSPSSSARYASWERSWMSLPPSQWASLVIWLTNLASLMQRASLYTRRPEVGCLY